MLSRRKIYFLVASLLVLVTIMVVSMPCFKEIKGADPMAFSSLDSVPAECWTQLSRKKIFFGHKSVGYNIVDGIMDVMREYNTSIHLNILETTDPTAFSQPVFAHAQVGKNMDPSTKINDFVRIMDSGLGNQVDIAFFKLCYVDIDRRSSHEEVFGEYKSAIESLTRRYPQTTFMNITTPLCSLPKSAKRRFKHLVKCVLRLPGVAEDNQARERYNKLLANGYKREGDVFDLALVESVDPDGYPNYTMGREQKAIALVSRYTDDGCHLNEDGRKRVAEQLLIKLAALACKE